MPGVHLAALANPEELAERLDGYVMASTAAALR